MVIIMIIASFGRICFYQLVFFFFQRSFDRVDNFFTFLFYQHIIYDNCVQKRETERISVSSSNHYNVHKHTPAFVWLASGGR